MEARSRLLDQPHKGNGSALSKSGRLGSPTHRSQRNGAAHGTLSKKKDGGNGHAADIRILIPIVTSALRDEFVHV